MQKESQRNNQYQSAYTVSNIIIQALIFRSLECHRSILGTVHSEKFFPETMTSKNPSKKISHSLVQLISPPTISTKPKPMATRRAWMLAFSQRMHSSSLRSISCVPVKLRVSTAWRPGYFWISAENHGKIWRKPLESHGFLIS